MPLDGLMIAVRPKSPNLPSRPDFKASGGRPPGSTPGGLPGADSPAPDEESGETDAFAVLKKICKMCEAVLKANGMDTDYSETGTDGSGAPPASAHDQPPPSV